MNSLLYILAETDELKGMRWINWAANDTAAGA
jgi:hypothetical protein